MFSFPKLHGLDGWIFVFSNALFFVLSTLSGILLIACVWSICLGFLFLGRQDSVGVGFRFDLGGVRGVVFDSLGVGLVWFILWL